MNAARMPRGAAPGERRGGRGKGTRNKATLERERIAAEIAARTVADARATGKKLAKDVLEEFMLLFAGMAASYQPWPVGLGKNPGENVGQFEKWARLACEQAAKLAPFQSPTFRAVMVSIPGTPGGPALPAPREDNVIELTDQNAIARVYSRIMKAS